MSSFLIPSRGRPDILNECLENLLSIISEDDEIIVAIHQSEEEYKDVILQNKDRVFFFSIDYECCCSHLWNQLILASNQPEFFILSDKARPQKEHIIRTKTFSNQGHALVALARFYFCFMEKYVIHLIGWFDERYEDGGFEDFDTIRRLREKDLSHYESDDVYSVPAQSSWSQTKSEEFFFEKWQGDVSTARAKKEQDLYPGVREKYKDLKPEKKYLPYSRSVLVPYNWYSPFIDVHGCRFEPEYSSTSRAKDPHIGTRWAK